MMRASVTILTLALFGCQSVPKNNMAVAPDLPANLTTAKASAAVDKPPVNGELFATANLTPKSGSNAVGTASFFKILDGIKVVVNVQNVSAGFHGLHIHETGDCSAPDAKSAGGHYNPAAHPHGSPDPAKYHAGDLGNINIDEEGNGVLVLEIVSDVNHDADWAKIVGKSLVLHNKADDLVSQPAGDSGDRIACGVIGGIQGL